MLIAILTSIYSKNLKFEMNYDLELIVLKLINFYFLNAIYLFGNNLKMLIIIVNFSEKCFLNQLSLKTKEKAFLPASITINLVTKTFFFKLVIEFKWNTKFCRTKFFFRSFSLIVVSYLIITQCHYS